MIEAVKQSGWLVTIAMFIAPVMFVYFFGRQVYLVHTYDFSVWKGGGMGMFSGPDHPSKRQLYLYTVNESGITKNVVPTIDNFFEDYDNFKTLPHPDLLKNIQEDFFKKQLYVTKETDSTIWLSDQQYEPSMRPFSTTKLRIELWKMDQIDNQENTLSINRHHVWETEQ
jgi:hypothetical protein